MHIHTHDAKKYNQQDLETDCTGEGAVEKLGIFAVVVLVLFLFLLVEPNHVLPRHL